jgi:NarL family two-component system sensor histidine kinase LiaS
VGFDVQEELMPPRGWGITGMRERVDSIGGELNLASAPGNGTSVEVVVPFSERQTTALQEEEQ